MDGKRKFIWYKVYRCIHWIEKGYKIGSGGTDARNPERVRLWECLWYKSASHTSNEPCATM